MSVNKSSAKVGLSFIEGLAILFIALKLCKVIDWSWVWVLSPIWIPVAIAMLLLAVYWCFVLKEKWGQRGTVQCRQCKYRGCLASGSFGDMRFRCTKDGLYHPVDYRCREGVKQK